MAGEVQTNAERFAAAHRALRADPDIQFDLARVTPPPPTPAWIRAVEHWLDLLFRPVGRFLRWMASLMPEAPYARLLLWSAMAASLVMLVWAVRTRLRDGAWRWPWRRRMTPPSESDAEDWRPESAPARAWLDEAEVLAAQGRYAEAAHHLLIRSIEDLGRRRPGLVRPALTSRDLARAPVVPPRARQLFAGIAAIVERSLFGGRPVDAEDWAGCRAAYEDFTRTAAWKAA